MHKPEASYCLIKWAIELGEHEIEHLPCKMIKGQAWADFLVEMDNEGIDPDNSFDTNLPEDHPKLWEMFVDRVS